MDRYIKHCVRNVTENTKIATVCNNTNLVKEIMQWRTFYNNPETHTVDSTAISSLKFTPTATHQAEDHLVFGSVWDFLEIYGWILLKLHRPRKASVKYSEHVGCLIC
ncbi:hypothetical protein CEXT_700231 [Caerostris extrusa]|uniref:Transposase n=1 Tax=Caerostris extrusa TaxID=172846 RepID=A0AAV4ULN4_CAEEX|nr:hypothetical protein CEXT_700231 [Caerostris extrusa]